MMVCILTTLATYMHGFVAGNSCNSVKDVVFVIDTSGSIARNIFTLIREFTAELTNDLIHNYPRSEVGVILFAVNAHIAINLQAHNSLNKLLTAINGLPYSGRKTTNTAEALRLLRSDPQRNFPEMLRFRGTETSKVAIVITGGPSKNPLETSLAATELHNFDVYAVGIGGADEDELSRIASNSKLVFFTTIFNSTSLQKLKDRILLQFCIGKCPVIGYIMHL